jgi:hypothetical protein
MTRLLRPVLAAAAAAAAMLAFAASARAQSTTAPASTRPASTRPATPQAAATAPTPQAATATTAATRPVADPADPAFAAAVKGLGAESWKQRQAAQETLVRFGEDAVPRLTQLARSADDEEVRTRAGAALRQVEENALVGPSTLTLHFKDARPRDVFAAIAKQARCEFPTTPPNLWEQNPGAPVTVDVERVDFWTAFKDVCQKTGCYPTQGGMDRRMTLQQNPGATYWNGPSVTSGPFLVVANRIHRANSVDLTNPAAVQHEFTLALSTFVEPKIRVVQANFYADVDEAVDDRGNSLVPTDRIYGTMSSGQQWMWNATARLHYPDPPNAGTRIARLKGNLKFQIQTRSETLEIPEILTARNVTKRIAGRRVVFKELKKTGEQYEVQLTIHRDGLSDREWNATQNPGYSIRLLDRDGHALAANGWGSSSGGPTMTYTVNYTRTVWNGQRNTVGEPHRLVWEIPTETRDVSVPFEFKNLPIP